MLFYLTFFGAAGTIAIVNLSFNVLLFFKSQAVTIVWGLSNVEAGAVNNNDGCYCILDALCRYTLFLVIFCNARCYAALRLLTHIARVRFWIICVTFALRDRLEGTRLRLPADRIILDLLLERRALILCIICDI